LRSRASLLVLTASLSVLPVLLGLPARSLAVITGPYSPTDTFDVSPGVSYEQGTLVTNSAYPRTVHLVEVDPTNPQVALRLSEGGAVSSDRATVVEQALSYSGDGHRVVATSNGSLFTLIDTGNTSLAGLGLGLNIADGKLINAGDPLSRPDPHPAFGITAAGAPVIGMPQTDIQLTLPGGETVAVDRINQVRADGLVALYTPSGSTHTWTDNLGDEYVIEGFSLPLLASGTYAGTVVAANHGAGDTTIGPGKVVLSVSQTAPAWATALSVGSEVSISVTTSAPWDTATQVVSGRDLLVTNGHAVAVDPARDGNDARTVVGIKANGKVILLAVDNGTLKKGLTLGEAASLMLSLGAVDAVNLDGGASTQLAVRQPGDVDATRITPDLQVKSGIIERPVVNALQVVSLAPDGSLDELVVTPSQANVAIGETLELIAKGRDSNLNGVALDYPSLEWGVARVGIGSGGTPALVPIASGVSLSPTEVGDYLVTVRKDALETSVAIHVVTDTAPPTLSGLGVAISDSTSVGKTSANVAVNFAAADNVGVRNVEIQRRLGAGRWRSIGTATSGLTSASLTVPYGQTFQFRLRATDSSGNRSAWMTTARYRLGLVDSGNRRLGLHGQWKVKSSSNAIGGSYLRSNASGANLQLAFTGVQVAAVGTSGPTYGQATVQIGSTASVPAVLHAPDVTPRAILYLSEPSTVSRPTSVKLVNVSTPDAPVVDLDAFLVLSLAK